MADISVKIKFEEHEGLMRPVGLKVLTDDLVSLGLRNCPRDKLVQYTIGEYVDMPEEFMADKKDRGGLWLVKRMGAARTLKRYMHDHYGIQTRIFNCVGGPRHFDVSNYRYKTDRIKLLDEIIYDYP